MNAAVLMALSAVLFGAMAITIRLASSELHAFEIAFFRNVFGLVATLPLLWRAGPSLLKTTKLPFYLLRCSIGIVSMLCGFWAIVNLPLAQAVALSYSTPLFVTFGAAFVLGEVVKARRWTAVLLGFIGVLVIVRPGVAGFSMASLVALTAAFASAMVAISIKILSRTEPPDAIVLFTTLIWVPLSFFPALPYWIWPSATGWLWVALAGFLGTAAHMGWTRALRLGDVSALTPISFVQLPVVAGFAWLLFGERLDAFTVLGAAIICAANIYIARREARLARREISAAEL